MKFSNIYQPVNVYQPVYDTFVFRSRPLLHIATGAGNVRNAEMQMGDEIALLSVTIFYSGPGKKV